MAKFNCGKFPNYRLHSNLKYIHLLDIGHCCSCVFHMRLYNQWVATS